MIFYNSPNPAPNPQRVRIFAAEKGIDLPTEDISIMAREQKSPEFLKINSRGQTPALKLDDGSVLTESVAICRYLEALHPENPLFGETPKEIGVIDMWMRRAEMLVMEPVGKVWVHTHPLTAKLPIQHFPEYGKSNRGRTFDGFSMCDERLGETDFLAGSQFTMADIILFSTVEFAKFIGISIPKELDHLLDWHARISARPSANA
ncbi:glutathione S-transferase family protein [Parasphingorhabdus halotolerans]|uniref:Glutathione S-transferase family protein n=1 Tax=Parasphingorhabdus halotolerans TaxID=2725558 RepID=A0A6H2DHY6_9SPHN|nr:glutathione S-transferase family protein [Parasphingorhabdus halotolerans]QJB68282.1 glutathione S-transferase family protein [Parasphingorhabdus halotolerans]